MNWIPVTERLPGEDEVVVAFVPDDERQRFFIGILQPPRWEGDSVCCLYFDSFSGGVAHVTHWAPLSIIQEPPA